MEGIIKLFSVIRLKKDKFIKEQEITRKEEAVNNTHLALIEEIRKTEQSLNNARNRFDLYTDNDLIDASIMEIDALEKRYAYLIKEAKKTNIAAWAI